MNNMGWLSGNGTQVTPSGIHMGNTPSSQLSTQVITGSRKEFNGVTAASSDDPKSSFDDAKELLEKIRSHRYIKNLDGRK